MAPMPPERQQVTGNINSFNTLTNYNHHNVFNFSPEIDNEGRQILKWLSPLEPQLQHQGVRIERLDGVGNWVLETNEFRKWSGPQDCWHEPVLFCYGNPGVGKTYLSSLVIDSLCDQAGGKDIAVVGLYCDFLAQQEQSTTSMLGAILKQLSSGGDIPEHIREAFRKAKKEFGGRGLLIPDLMEILKKTITSLPRVYICIDALDESVPKHRRDLLESLREIVRESPNTRIFLTGRPHINDEITKCFGEAVRIPISPTQDDIKSYLEMRLSGDTDPDALDDALRADIMRVIPEKISEIFLLVSLNIDAILGEITIHQRRKKLDEMTKGEGLSDAYTATLSRVKSQPRSRSKLGMEALMWVSHSERPLHVNELCHALGVEEGSTGLNFQNVPAIETLLACSLGLITVEKPSYTVRPIHYTLQEYLSHNPILFPKPHSAIAKVCLTYLNFHHVMAFSSAHSVPSTAPFVEYASCYWGTHARRETTESVETLALRLLDGYDRHISSKILLLHEESTLDQPFDRDGIPRGFTGLHGAAYLGCVDIVVALLKGNKCDVQATDFHGNTAIAWAARRGHERVVRILIERNDVDPNIADTRYGRTPLLWASRNGHERVVRALLDRNEVNPNKADTLFGQTPLSFAAENGYEGVARILLARNDLNPNTTDIQYGRTPLSLAAKNGYEGVVRILLERNDVNPNTADTQYGRTPLLLAVKNGYLEVVRMLLERNDVNPDQADAKYGRTPLSWAAENGREGVVRALLEQNDVNPDRADTKHGRTPLSRAAENGREGVVRILLEQNDVNPDQADAKYGRTPLSWAAGCGCEGVVRILLEQNDVNPDQADTKYGRTPLSWASGHGCEGVVRILLEQNDVNPDQADAKYGRTPLSWASGHGCEGVVRILLKRSDINPNKADKYGRTPLSLAAGHGCGEVVRILLKRSDINPNEADKYGRTPLSFAAENGHEGVARILLKKDDVDVNKADTYGRTPLSLAAENGHEGVMRILLKRININPNKADTDGRTPLSLAAENGSEGVVKVLLERKDVNPNTTDTQYGQTPLSWAAENGHEGVVRILLERDDVNPSEADTLFGQTPLSWAVRNGHEAVARILQERSNVNPNKARTLFGRIPTLMGYGGWPWGGVWAPLERNDVNPNEANNKGQPPLWWAARTGHKGS